MNPKVKTAFLAIAAFEVAIRNAALDEHCPDVGCSFGIPERKVDEARKALTDAIEALAK